MTTQTSLNIDEKALQKIKLVAVAYSFVQRELFPTHEAYVAEKEVEDRAQQVVEEVKKLGLAAKGYPADKDFLATVIADRPDVIVNLVDTVRGKDRLSSAVPAFLEYANIRYTGCGITGMVIGNNRHLFKELLEHHGLPTPQYKFIRDLRSNTPPDFDPPYIVKLNESGGSTGIDNKAVKETAAAAQKQVEMLQAKYDIPVLVEKFIDGPELAGIVFDDGLCRHVFIAQKKFGLKPDGKHEFTSLESYGVPDSYTFEPVDDALCEKASALCVKAFEALRFTDYAKFDFRLDEQDMTPYIIDANPNTAFGPDKGLPMTDIMSLNGHEFNEVLASLLSRHAKALRPPKEV
jgi:D-alanine-D-alanine ligase